MRRCKDRWVRTSHTVTRLHEGERWVLEMEGQLSEYGLLMWTRQGVLSVQEQAGLQFLCGRGFIAPESLVPGSLVLHSSSLGNTVASSRGGVYGNCKLTRLLLEVSPFANNSIRRRKWEGGWSSSKNCFPLPPPHVSSLWPLLTQEQTAIYCPLLSSESLLLSQLLVISRHTHISFLMGADMKKK